MDGEIGMIKKFLGEKIRVPPDQLPDSTELFTSGVFSSLTVLELIAFIERTYSIQLPPQELTGANFRNIASLAATVHARVAAESSGASMITRSL